MISNNIVEDLVDKLSALDVGLVVIEGYGPLIGVVDLEGESYYVKIYKNKYVLVRYDHKEESVVAEYDNADSMYLCLFNTIGTQKVNPVTMRVNVTLTNNVLGELDNFEIDEREFEVEGRAFELAEYPAIIAREVARKIQNEWLKLNVGDIIKIEKKIINQLQIFYK